MSSAKPFLKPIRAENAKSHLASQPPELRPHFEELHGLPARVLPIEVAALIDDALARALKAFLLDTPAADSYVTKMNNSARIELCRHLAIIPEDFISFFKRIATVRNHFAHESNPRFADKKPNEAIKSAWASIVTVVGTHGNKGPEAIKATIQVGHEWLDEGEEGGRLMVIFVYELLIKTMKVIEGNIERVEPTIFDVKIGVGKSPEPT